jgi:hypothetical protein
LLIIDVAVHKDDIALHAKVLGQALQRQAVGLPFRAHQVRVRCPEDHIHQVRMLFQNRWERFDAIFNSFAWGEQAEGEHHRSSSDAILILVEVGIHKGLIRDAVGDQVDFFWSHLVGVPQDALSALAHHDEGIALLEQFLHHPALLAGRVIQNCVQGGDHRQQETAHQIDQMTAGWTAIDSEFVLDAEEIGMGEIDKVCSALIT